ncbi:uncharacterized protein LOC126974338 isoform X2 [Leptidea sinapis]|nr:uncharacterized protein LOC126974338 isoform X2 [Leptidea sinapis]
MVRHPELCRFVRQCARSAAQVSLPLPYCSYVVDSVTAHAALLTFDQIGHILRELGVIWWEARARSTSRDVYAAYASHMAAILSALQRAFVAAAIQLSYAPERVSLYSWSSIVESWSAWVSPHLLPPLLPVTSSSECYTDMLQRFINCIQIVMDECPGCEEPLLRKIWSWTLETYNACTGADTSQESRVQCSALLATLGSLAWSRQWHADRLALQINTRSDREILAWCCQTLDGTQAATWLRAVEDHHVAPTLAALLALFTCANMHFSKQCLQEACKLPWWRLPESVLDSMLERYFAEHHNPAVPYHHLTHFCIMVSASQLSDHSWPAGEATPLKRRGFVSHFVRASVAPPLHDLVRAHCEHLLDLITDLAPHVSDEELEQLMSRASVVMCIQPAADVALQVWLQWLPTCSQRLRLCVMSAAAVLTSREHAVSLADRAAALHLSDTRGTGWCDLLTRWSVSVWSDASVALQRGDLHAAYVMLLAKPHDTESIVVAFNALQTASLNFSDNEVVISLWICVACRLFVQVAALDTRQLVAAALARWLEADGRRSLLQLVRLQASPPAPTSRHRMLCTLAQCITSPSEASSQAYVAACTAGQQLHEVTSWGLSPRVLHLVQLANRLHPNKELYFSEELKLAEQNHL